MDLSALISERINLESEAMTIKKFYNPKMVMN